MLVKLTARSILIALATAPPHLAAPFRLMHTAGPVEVLFLIVLISTVFALFKILVHFAFSLQKFGHVGPQLLNLVSIYSVLLVSFKKCFLFHLEFCE
jgi:hypothetical protein